MRLNFSAFTRLTHAKFWSSTAEYEIEQVVFVVTPTPIFYTFGDLIYHNLMVNETVPLDDTESRRLKVIQRELGA